MKQFKIVGPSTVTSQPGSCAGDTAAGPFNLATKGKWSGTWSSSYSDFDVTKILGETDNYSTTKTYWSLYVNNVLASTGICGVKLKAGEQILWAAVGNTETPGLPLGITISGTTAKVVYYTAKGKAKPLVGATVASGTSKLTTSAAGTVLSPGSGQVEDVTFTPTDSVDYATVSSTVTVNVAQATTTVSVGSTISLRRCTRSQATT